ncbi:hypothetical protein HYQ57_1977 [Lactobacillus crispatus]|uniref:hypothetical protein n=1 Tax=Lactobacillus crispatus TaxID=47770 RepID=UPI0018E3EF09|nr:hypothetical protein [Lactobacillus crispatus]MBI1722239.1 hypothetical protein [Lactobacillus crispatus]
MANIFAPGGYELATKNMIPGNGINLLDGTKDLSTFDFVISGNGGKDNDSNGRTNLTQTKVMHAWTGLPDLSIKKANIKYTQALCLVPGVYTLSFLAWNNIDSSDQSFYLYAYSDSITLGKSNKKVAKQADLLKIVFSIDKVSQINLIIGNNSSDTLLNGSIWYANLKLEAGVNPTPWSESPVDQIQELKSSLSK